MTSPEWIDLPHVQGVSHRAVDVHGLRLHVAEAGSGTPLLLLHGWPQHWWAWRHVVPKLAARHRVVMPDIRGLGWSQGRPGHYSIADLASDVPGLMDELEIERGSLIGHDWGAAIGYYACLTWPQRFESFVALGGLNPWAAEGAPLRLWLRPWHIAALAMCPPGTITSAVASRSLRTWRHIGKFTSEEVETYTNVLRKQTPATATRDYYRNVAFHELLHYARHFREMRLETRTLHLNGAVDPLTRGMARSWMRYANDMELRLVPGCGHFLPEECPDLVAQAVTDFFAAQTKDD